MLPTGAALLVLVMALVLLTIVVVAILIPGAVMIAKLGRKGQGLTILIGLAYALAAGSVAVLSGILAPTGITVLTKIAFLMLAMVSIVFWAVALREDWRRRRGWLNRVGTIIGAISWISYTFLAAFNIYMLFIVTAAR